MTRRFILAPEAAHDLVEIWRHLKKKAGVEIAERVERAIRDLTEEAVRFFSVYSYLIVYRPETKPVQVVAMLHGHRDVEHILTERLLE
jgi:antitoxin ParD1/3/4/toxin ParE1/3/4